MLKYLFPRLYYLKVTPELELECVYFIVKEKFYNIEILFAIAFMSECYYLILDLHFQFHFHLAMSLIYIRNLSLHLSISTLHNKTTWSTY